MYISYDAALPLLHIYIQEGLEHMSCSYVFVAVLLIN